MEPLGDEEWLCLPSHACRPALPGPAACWLCFLLLPRVPGSPSNCVAHAPCFKCKSIAVRMSSERSPSLATKVGPQKLHSPPWPPSGVPQAPWWSTALPAALPSSPASAFSSLGEVLEAQPAIEFSSWVAAVLTWFREHHKERGKDGFHKFPCLTGLFSGAYRCPVHRQSPGVWAEASDPKPVQTLASEQGINSGADQSQVSAPKTGAATGGSLMVCLSYAR